MLAVLGGGREIRTLGPVSQTLVFKTSAIDHSAIPPNMYGRRGGSRRSFVAKIVTEVDKNVHTLRDTIKQMDPTVRGIFWEAPQHHHVEKGNDWFLALAVIVIACVITALLLDNVMFALLLGLAGGVLGMSAAQRPAIVPYGVSVRGIKVEDELFPYSTLDAYHIDEEDGRGPQLLIRTHRKSIPLLVLPIPVEHVDDIESILEQRLPEELIHEPLFLKVLELFGF